MRIELNWDGFAQLLNLSSDSSVCSGFRVYFFGSMSEWEPCWTCDAVRVLVSDAPYDEVGRLDRFTPDEEVDDEDNVVKCVRARIALL